MSETPAMPSPEELIAGVDHKTRRADATTLLTLFREVTGFEAKVYKPSVIGFGRYDYTYESGHSGSCYATGFAPRKANMVVYILPGYTDFGHLLARLGKHKKGKACLYLGALSGVDLGVLRELVRAGLDDLATRWEIKPG